MNRKLHNAFTALMVSGAALALGLTFALPVPQPVQPEAIALQLGALDASFTPTDPASDNTVQGHAAQAEALARSIGRRSAKVETLADAAALTAEIATIVALAGRLEASEQAAIEIEKKQARTASRRSRQTLVMPYFSFAPRG
ncbi:hypothetical protein ACFOLC_01185 [Lysobacter cavernae]|uniref:Uncharacterized protein n=1 Tax=Lysobacter cavernae TaxID=1685901 RepID=A0ABV7RLF7_9GAMM